MSQEKRKKRRLDFSSILKGASRIVNLYGRLNKPTAEENADYFALKNDWATIGGYITISMNDYAEKKTKKSSRSRK